MKVIIKSFDVDMEVKNKGVEFEIRKPNNGKHLGDIIANKVGIIWCKGKTDRKNGKSLSWQKLIELIEANV